MTSGKSDPRRVLVAKRAGFCSGVKRAVENLLLEAKRQGAGSTLGPLVHNEIVTRHLAEQGIGIVNKAEEAQDAFIAIRTHGIKPALQRELEKPNRPLLIDLTCPRVKKIQMLAAELWSQDREIIVFGDPDHPEVEGLLGWAGDKARVVSSPEELENLEPGPNTALIAQSTVEPTLYEKARKVFHDLSAGGKSYDTLCPETSFRQKEIKDLAQRVEALVVVGSKTSANTNALYHSCRQLKPTCRVINAGELDPAFLERFRVFGVTAGASTPPWTIKEVVRIMENENLETKQEEQFDFDGEIKIARAGEQVTGKVARVTEDEVYVDIGAKTEAILPLKEVHVADGKALADIFSVEDEIEVTVLENDEQEGRVVVSHKRLARDKRLRELEQAMNEDQALEGRVKQVVPAGMILDLGAGAEGFMPGSLVDTRYVPDFKVFQDQQVAFKILEFDREKGKLILSRKKILEEENARKKAETLSAIKAGTTVNGTVKRLTSFGAFVDIGGIDGLVHISELSWERVSHPREVLKTGEEVTVKVLEVLPEKERISLSIRKTQPDPFTKAISDLSDGQLVKGKITRIVDFGAFIEIKPGVEGLAHISQLAEYHVNHPSEMVREGDEVEVKILEIKPKAKRIALSLKDAGGLAVAQPASAAEGIENGNVTLGDVFGNLFDQQALPSGQAEEKKVQESQPADEAEEGTEGEEE